MSAETFKGERSEESAEKLAKKQLELQAKATQEAQAEASEEAEHMIRMISARWAERGFTPEQCVWSLALATVNFRESMPEKFGGKAMFDRVAYEAKQYYDANRNR